MASSSGVAPGRLSVPRVAINESHAPAAYQSAKRPIEIESKEQYRDAILAHAALSVAQSLYAGPNYQSLADYLRASSRPSSTHQSNVHPGPSQQGDDGRAFVTLHDLHKFEKDRDNVQHFQDPDALITALKGQQNEAAPALVLFMSGYPSPEWMLSIGWLCNIDPEFWLRHFDFQAPLHAPTYFTTPALPSSVGNIIRLRIPTIGYRDNSNGYNQAEIQHLRDCSSVEMSEYASQITKKANVKTGDSVVRTFSMHDQEHYSLEQDMSMCVNKFGNGWIMVIWSDCGNDLAEGPPGPWSSSLLRTHSWKTSINPTVLHKPGIALKTRYLRRYNQQVAAQYKPAQSASALPLHYGRLHDQRLAAQDPFYAMNEVFSFAAFAMCQFLNMVEQKIVAEMARNDTRDTDDNNHEARHAWTVSNLLYSKNLLTDHIRRLQENASSIEAGPGPKWPQATEGKQQSKAKLTAETLLADYKYLLERAQMLSSTCDRGIDIAGNNAMIAESRTALRQARRVNKLTLLAFFFIPASFTTSLFGMNFSQFGQGELSIWVWVVVLIPAYLVSVLLLFGDFQKIIGYLTGGGKKQQTDSDGQSS